MKLEDELFKRKRLKRETLIPYGFAEDFGGYVLTREIMNGQFEARIFIEPGGKLSGKVFDRETDEEYVQVHLDSPGSYASKVREAYSELLEDIADKCYEPALFLFPQSNRLARQIGERYDEEPDYPFGGAEDGAVFRYPGTRKWYGLIMNIPEKKLDPEGSEDTIEVLNVKINPEKREKYLGMRGVYPAYHMNREKWLSINLNESVSDHIIMDMVDESRQYAVKGAGKSVSEWLVPANPQYYDLDTLFSQKTDVLWKQGMGIREGDTVYMYLAAPVSAVRYKCIVTEMDIPYEFSNDVIRMTKLMKMDVVKQYPDDHCPFNKLKELGITAVRGPRKATQAFLDYIDKE